MVERLVLAICCMEGRMTTKFAFFELSRSMYQASFGGGETLSTGKAAA